MRKLIVAFLLSVSLAAMPNTAWAQTDAGFLDSPPAPGGDPYSVYDGAGWYCIQRQFWPNPDILIAGSFPTQPNCSAY